MDWGLTVEKERRACSVVVMSRGMEANTDPSTPALLRGEGACSAPPMPLKFSGKGSLTQIRFFAGFWLLGMEATIASSCRF